MQSTVTRSEAQTEPRPTAEATATAVHEGKNNHNGVCSLNVYVSGGGGSALISEGRNLLAALVGATALRGAERETPSRKKHHAASASIRPSACLHKLEPRRGRRCWLLRRFSTEECGDYINKAAAYITAGCFCFSDG